MPPSYSNSSDSMRMRVYLQARSPAVSGSCSSFSPTLRVELLGHILALRERDGITLLIIEHDLDFVMRASDRVIVMNDGKVIAEGSPDEVRADERVIDAYLGAQHEVA